MLAIPQKDFHRSTSSNNVAPDVLGDWIEASLLFHENEISRSDVIDVLTEQQICSSNDGQYIADSITISAWEELENRKRWSCAAPNLKIDKSKITDTPDWRNDIVRAFFLMLSIMRIYPDWATQHRNTHRQGILFEQVVEQIFLSMFPGWDVYRAGWFPGSSLTINQIISDLCSRLNCQGNANLHHWVPTQTKDGGLDIVCYHPFPDTREAIPTFFIQCASGANWRNKVQTPNARQWQKYLDAAVQPSTGIAAPFVISDKNVRCAGLEGQVIVFDRLRLLYAAHTKKRAFPAQLLTKLEAWLEPLVQSLPQIN